MRRGVAAFTLLEVLVALAIVGVALAAAVRASGVSVDSAGQVRDRLLATWVAENRLAEINARRQFPDLGTRSGAAQQAGRNFTWEETVGTTPNADFRRVEIRVRASGGNVAATLVGYVGTVQGD